MRPEVHSKIACFFSLLTVLSLKTLADGVLSSLVSHFSKGVGFSSRGKALIELCMRVLIVHFEKAAFVSTEWWCL